MERGLTVIGLGEALWDVLPAGKVLGGAPLNVACHVHALLGDWGSEAIVASRVGIDALGAEAIRELERRGMNCDLLQRDPLHPTSTVNVAIEAGQPTYSFAPDVAWDHLEFIPSWRELAARCHAVCFGTLAQRSPESRRAIWQFLDAAPRSLRLFDVNLRQGFYDRESIRAGCERATLVKLNEHELAVVAEAVGLRATTVLEQLTELRDRFDLEAVVFTRGPRGTLLVLADEVIDAPPRSFPAAANADAVGAGDACSAGVLVGWLLKLPPRRIGALANHLGAYVASQPGATPPLPLSIRTMID